jgi:dipeptidyl aminopeptidase/acylaminoacyl peptidase
MSRRISVALLAGLLVATKAVQAAPLPILSFAQLPRTISMSISPDGTRTATLSSVNGRKGIIIRSLVDPNAKPITIGAPGESMELRWVKWANNEYLLAGLGTFYRRTYLDDNTRETRMLSIKADGAKMLNAVQAKKEREVGSLVAKAVGELNAVNQDDVIDWSPEDSSSILLSIFEDQRSEFSGSVRKVNVATGGYETIMSGRRNIWRYSTDANGEVRFGSGSNIVGREIKYFYDYRDSVKGWITRTQSDLNTPDYNLVAFTKDPRFAYVIGPAKGRNALLKWDMSTDQLAEILYQDDKLEIEHIFWDDNSRILYGVKLSDDSNVYLDQNWSKRMRSLSAALPGYTLSLESATPDNSKFVVRAENSQEPGLFYLFDEKRKSLEVVEYAYAGIGPENLANREWVEYKSRDGLTINAVLTRPRSAPKNKPLPTILLPHGGPWAHDGLEFDWLAQFLADRGYLVLQPNFRGSDGYGKALLDAGDRQWGLAMQDDLSDGLKYLVANGMADAKHVCIVGGSYGGYAALWGVVKDPDQYQCAVSLNGVSDVLALLLDDGGGLKDEASARRIGNINSGRDALKAVSPINFVDKIKAPILLVHSQDDGRVDIKQSRRMADKLKAAGKTVDFIEVERGEHSLENEASRVTFLTALEAFLMKHLAP